MSAPIGETRRVVLYTANERFWHWTQAALIIGLLLTGGALRYPGAFPAGAFAAAVTAHNLLAGLLLVHAVLGLFYFVTTGQIRHYVVERAGLKEGLIKQVVFYAYGMFKGFGHPFQASERRRLNLLQRLSYLGLLNVLLPLQVLTGLALFFAEDLPALVAGLGGFPVLMSVHAVAAWSFLAFLVMHIYLTTTGHTVFEHLGPIVHGEAEVPAEPTEGLS
ncbi:MAG: cytochrome b/b6 domain-containing protein [Myxococcales bacterium]|nr:cytochrome b/b6 domain-containing protein [Myxococcales bacterium]